MARIEKVGAWRLPDGTYTESMDEAKKAAQLMVITELLGDKLHPSMLKDGSILVAFAEKLDEINRQVKAAL